MCVVCFPLIVVWIRFVVVFLCKFEGCLAREVLAIVFVHIIIELCNSLGLLFGEEC